MAKKTTLATLSAQLTKMDERMEKGFETHSKEIKDLTESVGFVVKHMTTKDQVLTLQTQVNSIERQLRDTKTEVRLGKLEHTVFGKTRR